MLVAMAARSMEADMASCSETALCAVSSSDLLPLALMGESKSVRPEADRSLSLARLSPELALDDVCCVGPAAARSSVCTGASGSCAIPRPITVGVAEPTWSDMTEREWLGGAEGDHNSLT